MVFLASAAGRKAVMEPHPTVCRPSVYMKAIKPQGAATPQQSQ